MIRYAREFEGTQKLGTFENSHFDIAMTPHAPSVAMLPRKPPANHVLGFDDPPEGPTVQDDDSPPLQDLTPEDDDEDWEAYHDDDYDITPVPLTSTAGVLLPSDSSQAHVFCGNRYVTIKVSPGTMGDTPARGSKPIADDWPSLWNTFGGMIDAVLPIPNEGSKMYFFSLESYVLIDTNPGS